MLILVFHFYLSFWSFLFPHPQNTNTPVSLLPTPSHIPFQAFYTLVILQLFKMGESRESYRKDFNAVSSKTGEETICTDLAFTTTHPPDVSQRSRIVAVCGITDYDNLADPQLDGWFFSDFYLFHYLFNPLRMCNSPPLAFAARYD